MQENPQYQKGNFLWALDEHIAHQELERRINSLKFNNTKKTATIESPAGKKKQFSQKSGPSMILGEGKGESSLYPVTFTASMLEAQLPFGYEFLPNESRLVITPLTEKVFQSLFLALHYQYGGAPVGPVGTGKTESIKELSKMSARHCYVFNCQSSIDLQSMAKFFKGLASNGSWVCFDEFNRLKINILSVISQYIIVIQKAKRQMQRTIVIDNSVLNFQRHCAPFITMNPFFVGRTLLPDNLKALFRTITMAVPNTIIIAEIILYSNGFGEARKLALKISKLFEILSEQLKFCSHYDFGLRQIKTILVSAGNMKLRAISVQTKEELAMEKALISLGEYMGAVSRTHKE